MPVPAEWSAWSLGTLERLFYLQAVFERGLGLNERRHAASGLFALFVGFVT